MTSNDWSRETLSTKFTIWTEVMNVIRVLANSLLKFAKFLNLVAQFVCYRLLELIVVVIVMQVILRFGFNSPTKVVGRSCLD